MDFKADKLIPTVLRCFCIWKNQFKKIEKEIFCWCSQITWTHCILVLFCQGNEVLSFSYRDSWIIRFENREGVEWDSVENGIGKSRWMSIVDSGNGVVWLQLIGREFDYKSRLFLVFHWRDYQHQRCSISV